MPENLDDKSKNNKEVPGMDDPQVVIFNLIMEMGTQLARCAGALEDMLLIQAKRAKEDDIISEKEFDEMFDPVEEPPDVPS